MATAGIIHVNRNMEQCPVNAIEQQYTTVQESEVEDIGKVVKLGARLGGLACSSTRAETATVVIALTAQLKLNFASDSASMFSTLDPILAEQARKHR